MGEKRSERERKYERDGDERGSKKRARKWRPKFGT